LAGEVAGNGVRNAYAAHPDGAAGYYIDEGALYRNPHEDAVEAMVALAVKTWPDVFGGRVLDLCCGSGEATLALRTAGIDIANIDACDPYTGAAYQERVGRPADSFSFADIAADALQGRSYSAVVCSYALHLCEQSWLPRVCLALAEVSSTLVIITPHKRPELSLKWGWELTDEHRDAFWRVRLRLYDTVV
jgi:SAM-dependent methyltransferase